MVLIVFILMGVVAFILLILVYSGLRVVQQYERGVVFRLGRLQGAKGPGLFWIWPVISKMRRIDLRIITLEVAPQEVITRDNVTLKVTAVVYFYVVDPAQAVVEVLDYVRATSQMAQTTLRNVLGQSEHIQTQPPTPLTTQRKAAPWGYFLYCEVVKIFRNPPAVVLGIGFPTIFFLIFGNTFSASYTTTILASYVAYGAFIVSFQTFSISLANERSLGWNKPLRTTPMSATIYLGSKFLVIILTGIMSMVVLFAVAVISGKVQMDLVVWTQLLGLIVVGMIPLSLLGLFLGLLGSANLTTALSTSLMLLLSFASGLWIPLSFMPDLIRKIAPYLPTYHLGQLAWITVGSSYNRGNQPLWVHLLILLAYAAVFAVLAGWAYIRDEKHNFA